MYQRILIMGSPGSGKSTLARRMGEASGIPVFHLDAFFWQPGWQEPDPDIFAEQVRRIAAGERWIIDGGYSQTLGDRLNRADLAVFLQLPRRTCIPRVVRRRFAHRNRTRPDMGEECPEKIDLDFLRFIWNYPNVNGPRVLSRLACRPPDVTLRHLRSTGEIEAFLAEFEAEHAQPTPRQRMLS